MALHWGIGQLRNLQDCEWMRNSVQMRLQILQPPEAFILQDWLCFNYTSTRAQSALHKAEYFFVLASVAALLVRHCHLGCRRPQPQARHRPSQGNGTLTLT